MESEQYLDSNRWMICPDCHDTGMKYPDCETCEGMGWTDDPDDGGTMTCPECFGEACETCEDW